MSITVTGLDEWKWTTYFFEDTYFEDDEYRERIEAYQNPALDPVSVGKRCLDKPICCPREFFLSVFAARVQKIKREWSNLTFKVLEHSERYVCIALYVFALSY